MPVYDSPGSSAPVMAVDLYSVGWGAVKCLCRLCVIAGPHHLLNDKDLTPPKGKIQVGVHDASESHTGSVICSPSVTVT